MPSQGSGIEINDVQSRLNTTLGGCGLFGVITRATLRLVPRTKVRRMVMVIPVRDAMEHFEDRLRRGFV